MATVSDHLEEIDGQPIFWREADGGDVPVVYIHGVPTSSDDWLPFLKITGGFAPDLPGFGRSGKRGDGEYSMEGYDRWIERFLDDRGIDRFRLVTHDWGAVGLLTAQRFPERVQKVVVMDAIPFLPGYKWHWIARCWRTPAVGETFMGLLSRPGVRQLSRMFNATKGPMPDAFIDEFYPLMDAGTQRAILRLYRSSPPDKLALAGLRLGELACPSLVVWGDKDPFVGAAFADAYGEALPNSEVMRLPDAGHWPWYDRPDLIETITGFLDA